MLTKTQSKALAEFLAAQDSAEMNLKIAVDYEL